MVAGPVQENLGLVFEPPERARMNDPRTVALKLCPISVTWLGKYSSARLARFLRRRRESGAFSRFHLFAGLPTIVHCQLLLDPGVNPYHAEALREGWSLAFPGAFSSHSSSHHLLDVDLPASDPNFLCNARCARRACSRSTSRSNRASRSAVKVSQMQTIQNRITRHGCS